MKIRTTWRVSHHHHRVLLAAGAAVGLMGVGGEARGQQWTAISLHPAGANESVANGVEGVVQVGTLNHDQSAVIWRGSAWSATRLNPSAGHKSVGNWINDGQQVGWMAELAGSSRATIWSGTAQSWVDLHPYHMSHVSGTVAYTKHGSVIGGIYFVPTGEFLSGGRPCIWTDSSPESWVNLTPAGYTFGEVLGVFGNQQVGTTNDSFFGKAAMWHGTAESFVDLHPPGALASVAACTDGVHQYGTVAVLAPVPGIFAARWSGTAESWEDMGQPEGWFGAIGAVHGGWKAGSIQSPDGLEERAMVWTDGPGSYVDLHGALPEGVYLTSVALGIWRHLESGTTYVVGSAINAQTELPEAMMWVTGPGVNLITSALAPEHCSTLPGDEMVYTARVINAGEETAGPVTLTVTLPPASVAAFAGSTPAPTSVSPTAVTINLGSIAAVGGMAEATIRLTALQAGGVAALEFSASAAGEVHAENNVAEAASMITPVPPASAKATAILTNDPSLDNSLVPGLGGARFTAFAAPAGSPSGNWWAVMAGTDLDVTQRHLLLRTPTGGTPAVAVQYGTTVTSNGPVDDILPGVEVNDAGLIAFGGHDEGPAPGRFVATTDGTTLTEVAREGNPVPGLPGEFYGPELGGSVNILADGSTAFLAEAMPAGGMAYFSNNGATLIAQQWVTFPVGADFPLSDLAIDIFNRSGCQVDATGTQHIYTGRLATGNQDDDQVVAVNGAMLMQEGMTVLPGMTLPVGGGEPRLSMSPGGVWMVRWSNTDREPWLAMGQDQTLTRLFRLGDPIHAGASEVWASDRVTPAFSVFGVDAAGNYVVGGTTSNADEFKDFVLVYNDEVVVARENDPVDLDGNGVFDDGAYIRSFEGPSVVFLPGALLMRVTLRDEVGGLCSGNNDIRGEAIIRIELPGGCAVDWNGDGSVNSADISAFLTSWLDSLNNNNLNADFDHSGSVNSADISAFLAAWLQGVQGNC